MNEKPKYYFWMVLDVLIVVAIINVLFFVMPFLSRLADSYPASRTITVTAEGKTTVSPDIAETSFSVVSRGKNPQDLTDNNNQKVAAAIQFVKSQGIDAKDIKTTGYNLNPDYQYDRQTQRNFITGYTLTQTVSVKIRDLSKVASIIGGLTPLGVNQIGGVNFTVDDPDKALGDARADAIKKAQAKAQLMAQESHVSLGRVLNVEEYQNGPRPYYAYDSFAKGMGGGVSAPAAAPTIEPGTQDVTIQVSITYELD